MSLHRKDRKDRRRARALDERLVSLGKLERGEVTGLLPYQVEEKIERAKHDIANLERKLNLKVSE